MPKPVLESHMLGVFKIHWPFLPLSAIPSQGLFSLCSRNLTVKMNPPKEQAEFDKMKLPKEGAESDKMKLSCEFLFRKAVVVILAVVFVHRMQM